MRMEAHPSSVMFPKWFEEKDDVRPVGGASAAVRSPLSLCRAEWRRAEFCPWGFSTQGG